MRRFSPWRLAFVCSSDFNLFSFGGRLGCPSAGLISRFSRLGVSRTEGWPETFALVLRGSCPFTEANAVVVGCPLLAEASWFRSCRADCSCVRCAVVAGICCSCRAFSSSAVGCAVTPPGPLKLARLLKLSNFLMLKIPPTPLFQRGESEETSLA